MGLCEVEGVKMMAHLGGHGVGKSEFSCLYYSTHNLNMHLILDLYFNMEMK